MSLCEDVSLCEFVRVCVNCVRMCGDVNHCVSL